MNSGNKYQVKHVRRIFFQCQSAGQKCFPYCEQMFGSTQGVDTLNSSPVVGDIRGSCRRGCEGEVYSVKRHKGYARQVSWFEFRIGTQVALLSKSLSKAEE